MTRFFEKYGDAVIIAFISLVVLGGAYAFMHLLATHGLAPTELGSAFLDNHAKAAGRINAWIDWMQKNWPMVGAIFQAAASLFAVVQGINLLRRRLPRQLQKFIEGEIKFVYPMSQAILASERIVGTIPNRSVVVRGNKALFDSKPLIAALKSIGKISKGADGGGWKYTPIRVRSLDNVETEAKGVAAVAEVRLAALNRLRLHSCLVRGALSSAETRRLQPGDKRTKHLETATRDFDVLATQIETRTLGHELRGLLRSREGNLAGALEDFAKLADVATEDSEYLLRARAGRYRGEVLHRMSGGAIVTRLKDAQSTLNDACGTISGRSGKNAEDWFEMGENRLTYAVVKRDLWLLRQEGRQRAEKAAEEAVKHFTDSGLPAAKVRIDEVEQFLAGLRAPLASNTPDDGGKSS